MELTKTQLLSLEIGLDTGDEEFIEADGFDWFPIIIKECQRYYTAQFFKVENEIYGDTRAKFRIKLNHKPQYLTVRELSSLEMGGKFDYDCEDTEGFTWLSVFIKTPEGLIYNPYLPDLDSDKYRFRITLKDD